MPDWFGLIIIALATWRVTSLITSEDGPFNSFRWLRKKTGIIHDEDGSVAAIPEKTLAKLFSCLWCMSLWIAIGMWLVWISCPIIVVFLALSTGAIMIDRVR